MKKYFLFLFFILSQFSLGKTYRIVDMGADTTGIKDSYPIFEKIITEATRVDKDGNYIGKKEDLNLHIILGEGHFRISKFLNFNYSRLRNLIQHKIGITIEGAGVNKSKIIAEDTYGGIKIDFRGDSDLGNNNIMVVTIKNLSVIATKPKQSYGITILKKKHGVLTRQLIIENVSIKGSNNNNYFVTGINAPNLWRPQLSHLQIIGKNIGTPSHLLSINYPMVRGIDLSDSYQPRVLNSTIQFATYGLTYSHKNKQLKDGPEDGVISDNKIIDVRFGMILFTRIVDGLASVPWEEPGLHIANNIIRYYDKGLWIKGLRQANISHNKFYRKNYDKNSQDIWLNYGSSIIIDHNEFDGEMLSEKVAIQIASFSRYSSGKILIVNNLFNNRNSNTYSIVSHSQSTSYAGNNTFKNSPKAISSYINYRNENIILKNNHK